MRNKTVGRNDLCPCGSGRKYKRCCLAEDERRQAQTRAAVPQAEEEEVPAAVPPVGTRQITGLLQKLAHKSRSSADRAAFDKLLARTQPILEYMKQQPAIEAAAHVIEAYRADFDKLIEDEEGYEERTRLLFAEERFVPLRFTADDVQRAFNKVGRPTPGSSDDTFV